MNYEIGDIITLDKGDEYLVVDFFKLNDNHYLYVISTDGKNETAVFRCIDQDVIKVDNKDEYNKVIIEVINRNKDEIDKIMEGVNEN